MPRPRPVLLVLVAVAAAATTGVAAVAPSAVGTPRPRGGGSDLSLTPIGTYASGGFDEGAAEIVAYGKEEQRAFVVNAQAGTVDVLDLSDPTTPALVDTLDTPGANSVDVHDGLVAVAQQADPATQPGSVSIFRAGSLRRVIDVGTGALPDMVTFTPDGETLVVANEGEPEGYCEGQVDPRGSVSVIDLSEGVRNAIERRAGFRAYDGREGVLRRAGVRLFGPGASAAQDLEPEYVAVSANGRRAWVTLQENNALALVDLRRAAVTEITALGAVDHGDPRSAIDASDEDSGVEIRPRPVQGLPMPDGIDAFEGEGGRTFLVTADEGDAREYDCFEEEVRVADLTLDPAVFPGAPTLQEDANLGRLNVTSTSPQGPDGYTSLRSFGTRSVQVRDAEGRLVWDSGTLLEDVTSTQAPEVYNADNAENGADARSDSKGPEPEGIEIGRVGGRPYAFVGLERTSGIAVFDLSRPRAPRLVAYADNRDPSGDPEAGTAGDLGPEGLHFVPAGASPNGSPLLLVGNEVSGTTSVWEVEQVTG